MTATDLAATLPADGQPVPKTGRLDWNIFLAWLVGRAKAGVPVDTVLGNYDMYLEWLRMFAKPTADAGMSQGDILRQAGVDVAIRNPRIEIGRASCRAGVWQYV